MLIVPYLQWLTESIMKQTLTAFQLQARFLSTCFYEFKAYGLVWLQWCGLPKGSRGMSTSKTNHPLLLFFCLLHLIHLSFGTYGLDESPPSILTLCLCSDLSWQCSHYVNLIKVWQILTGMTNTNWVQGFSLYVGDMRLFVLLSSDNFFVFSWQRRMTLAHSECGL